jgi:predicted flap endonuclease-1-like 5' DNA nuclease
MANQVEGKKNWAVYVLFLLAVIAGILAFIDAGRYMGWLDFTATIPGFGEISFALPNAQWFAALMSALLGVIWFVVASWLWNLNPSGLLFMKVIAVINLIFLGLALLGRTSFSDIIWAVLVNVLILILSSLSGTKAAFAPAMAKMEAAAAAKSDTATRAADAKSDAAESAADTKADAAAGAVAGAAAVKAAAPEAAPDPQDLTVVEGIGPKIGEALQGAGIHTFADLAGTSNEDLAKILNDAGLSADPTTWSKQAAMAAAGNMDDLKAYQDKLEGGREV